MNKIALKEKLMRGELCLGSWITLGHSGIAEIFARSGFDWVVVDLEHSMISIDQAGDLIRTIDLAGAVPLVRLTSNNSDQVKRIMDAGACGIVVPNINSVEEAMQAISATRYAPLGNRGVGLGRAQDYGPGFKDYLEWQKNGPIVIVMIENISALKNLKEILSLKGVDGFIIGPYDLSCSMGIPGEFEKKEFVSTIQFILEEGIKAKCPAGIHIVEPDIKQLENIINMGYRLIAYGVDIRMLDIACREGIKFAKATLI
jgi:2-keto-3-deoxy-L-rhamnonate aldolase RhmA